MDLACIRLVEGLADHLVVVNLQHSALVCVLESTLKVFGNLLLTELFLDAIDNCHDSLYVSVKDISFLQALESNLALFCTSLVSHASVSREDG